MQVCFLTNPKSVFWIFLNAFNIKKYFMALSFTYLKQTSNGTVKPQMVLLRKTFWALKTQKTTL